MMSSIAKTSALVCATTWSLLSSLALAAPEHVKALQEALRAYDNKIFRAEVKPHWLADGTFWYRVQTGPARHEYVMVDPVRGTRRAAESLAALGLPEPEALHTRSLATQKQNSENGGDRVDLRFQNRLDSDVELFWVDTSGNEKSYGVLKAGQERTMSTFASHAWMLRLNDKKPVALVKAPDRGTTVVVDGPGQKAKQERRGPGVISPDGRWRAEVEEGRVMLVEVSGMGARRTLECELNGKHPFREDGLQWAPDSKKLVAVNAPEYPQREITLVEAAPAGQVQPKLKIVPYTKPGDELPKPCPVVFHLETGRGVVVDDALFPNPFTERPVLRNLLWSPSGDEFFFDYNQRGHQLYRVLAVHAETGVVRVVVEEKAATFIDYSEKTWRHWLDARGELLWMSERDGWAHLWLLDQKTGGIKKRVTTGPWVVRQVLHVDEAGRQVWFLASGRKGGEDPYHQHLCRAGLDDGNVVQLTDGDGDHDIQFSPDRKWFLDTWSRADHPPVIELREAASGALRCVLERADISALLATGWVMPERFVAPGRDGRTEIHGVIYRPPGLDAARRYPVVEQVYAGPHGSFAPKRFSSHGRQQVMAAVGFVVVQADGMGTDNRGKAFQDVAWKKLKDAGFPDRIAWIKAAATTRPWMDLERVGIYGGSAGGQNAMRAVLDHHDFYRVAVADCGCHDNRMDKIWWNEQWMGWPVDDSYLRSSNVVDAPKLGGKLLLIVGELDTNVDPASTMQVVAALQKAGKEFEFAPIAGAGHGAAETPYGSWLRLGFLTRHLLGKDWQP